MQPACFFAGLGLAVGLLTGEVARAAEPTDAETAYAESLVAAAREQALADDPAWLNLLHYRPQGRSHRSLVDDPRFFNSPRGKTDPAAELDATLRAFFAPPGTNALDHAMCRFVARYAWLHSRLQIDANRLPLAACEPFEAVTNHLQVVGVTLVFPAAYMSGPASMFGHTLLVFDSAGKNRLLSRAVSYAARTDERIGPLFAFAGIAGLYPGYYAIQPYYEKVEQYGDIGHRDVWEYELDFTTEEVQTMVRHAWELQNIWSRYFFFTENCAYNLFYFMDVARPDLRLTDHPRYFVIPIETVRSLARGGLVRNVEYRPSPVTRIRHLAERLSPEPRRLAHAVAHGKVSAAAAAEQITNATERVIALELAANYVQYRYTEEELSRERYTPLLMETLRVRSRLGVLPDDCLPATPAVRPDEGHAPIRVSPGMGSDDGDLFLALRGRFAYHALLDNHAGYDKGAEIQFGSTEVRFDPDRDEWRLERFRAVEVTALSPRDTFFKPACWKFLAGLSQARLEPDQDDVVLEVQTGAGMASERDVSDLYFGWIEARALGGGELGEEDYALGTGPALGYMKTLGPRWKHLLEARATWFGLGREFWDLEASWSQDWLLTRNRSLSVELLQSRRNDHDRLDAQLRLNLYF